MVSSDASMDPVDIIVYITFLLFTHIQTTVMVMKHKKFRLVNRASTIVYFTNCWTRFLSPPLRDCAAACIYQEMMVYLMHWSQPDLYIPMKCSLRSQDAGKFSQIFSFLERLAEAQDVEWGHPYVRKHMYMHVHSMQNCFCIK